MLSEQAGRSAHMLTNSISQYISAHDRRIGLLEVSSFNNSLLSNRDIPQLKGFGVLAD